MNRTDVYKIIDGEREYQDKKWDVDVAAGKELHSPLEFIAFIQDYCAQGIHEVCRNQEPKSNVLAMTTIRKIAGLAVAAMEQHDTPKRETE